MHLEMHFKVQECTCEYLDKASVCASCAHSASISYIASHSFMKQTLLSKATYSTVQIYISISVRVPWVLSP